MHLKKYFVSIVSLLATNQIIASENQNSENNSNINNNNIGLNFYLTGENSVYQNIKIKNIEFKYPKNIRTGSLQAGALYELGQSMVGNLVIGGGFDLYDASYQNIVKLNNNSINLNIDLKTTSYIPKATIGYKFTPSDRVSFYTLGSVGYAIKNNSTIKAINLNTDDTDSSNINVKNHITYGVKLISAFNVTNSFDVGLGLGVTGHSMRIENKDQGINQKLNYFDVNTSLSLIYKI